MGSAEQTPTADTFEELIDQIHGPREVVVRGLHFYGGKANSQELRRYGNIPSRNYHFKKLEEKNVIEQDGSEQVAQGGSAKVYHLTGLGQEVAATLAESSGEITTITEIEERLREHEDQLTQLQEKVEEMDDLLYDIAVHTGILDE
jgi:predicted MarR family transcription regulator